jgi:tRNA 2-thiouridine synthesizing protein A
MTEINANVILDVKGLTCPMPVLKTKKAIEGMGSGQTLEVIATDPASKADIPAFLSRCGHELVEAGENDGIFSFLIKRIPRCSASGWDNKKCVIARLDRAIQCLDLWIPRSSRRMTNVVFSITDTLQLCCSVIH